VVVVLEFVIVEKIYYKADELRDYFNLLMRKNWVPNFLILNRVHLIINIFLIADVKNFMLLLE